MLAGPDDVLVVGGGPAGAALATWLGERGRRVRVIDRARFPRDKVCGECLSPGGLGLLAELGVAEALVAAGARPYRGLRLVAPDGAIAEAAYPEGARGYTLPRPALDAVLLDRARRVPGVSVHEGLAVTGLCRLGDRPEGAVHGVLLADGSRLFARVVVGADGRFSSVRRLAFGRDLVAPAGCNRFCFVASFAGAADSDDWLECGLVGPGLQYLRVDQGAGLTSVCLVVDAATRDAHQVGTLAGFERLARSLPRLGAAIAHARPATPLKGMPMAPYRPAAIVADGLALVGDAVGFMDSITGEGMCRALHASKLAAETIDRALSEHAGVLPAPALAPYARTLAARFDPVVGFVDLAVRLTTLPAPASCALVRTLAAWPAAAEAFAAVQAALMPPKALYRPWAWPAARPGLYAPPGRAAWSAATPPASAATPPASAATPPAHPPAVALETHP